MSRGEVANVSVEESWLDSEIAGDRSGNVATASVEESWLDSEIAGVRSSDVAVEPDGASQRDGVFERFLAVEGI